MNNCRNFIVNMFNQCTDAGLIPHKDKINGNYSFEGIREEPVYGGTINDYINFEKGFYGDNFKVFITVNKTEYLLTADKECNILNIEKNKLFIDGMYYCLNYVEGTKQNVTFETFKRAFTRFIKRNTTQPAKIA